MFKIIVCLLRILQGCSEKFGKNLPLGTKIRWYGFGLGNKLRQSVVRTQPLDLGVSSKETLGAANPTCVESIQSSLGYWIV